MVQLCNAVKAVAESQDPPAAILALTWNHADIRPARFTSRTGRLVNTAQRFATNNGRLPDGAK